MERPLLPRYWLSSVQSVAGSAGRLYSLWWGHREGEGRSRFSPDAGERASCPRSPRGQLSSGEGRIRRDGVNQIEAGAGDDAALRYIGGAVQLRKAWQADKGREREPVAPGAVGSDRAQAQRTERRGAEGLQWIERSQQRVRILQDEIAVRHAEQCMNALIGISDLDLTGARKRFSGLQGKGELLVHGQIILVRKMDRGSWHSD